MTAFVLLIAALSSASYPPVARIPATPDSFVIRLEYLRSQDRRAWNRVPSLTPVPGAVMTSAYGADRIHPVRGDRRPHYGLDMRAASGTPIRSAAEGLVTAATRTPDYGWAVDVDHGNGFITRYAHATRLMVRQGDIVRRGQVIALSGATGRVKGPHLHYEVFLNGWSVDPCPYLVYESSSDRPSPRQCSGGRQ